MLSKLQLWPGSNECHPQVEKKSHDDSALTG